MNIHIPGRAASTTAGTKNSTGATSSNNPPLVTMPTESLASHFPKPEFDKTVGSKQVTGRTKSGKCLGYFPDKTLSEDQTLRDIILTMPNDDPDDVPRSRNIPGPSCVMGVEKNISSRSVQSIPDTSTNMNPQLLQETHWYSRDNVFNDGRGLYATKENICPNTGNDLVIDGDNNVDGLKSTRSDQSHSLVLSPIPVSNRMTCTGFDSLSEKQVSNDGPRPSTIPFVNYSNSPECSKHIFVTQPSEGVETHSRNEAIDVSISDKHSPEYIELLDSVNEQEKRINVLEREAEKRNGRIEELVGTNAKLNARVMVLETAVALIQEKIES